MRNLRLKKWVKVILNMIFIILLIYIIVSLFTKKEVIITEGKNYTCYGSKILQVCSGKTYE